ncbi:hypothetical protein F511_44562 [Dorcoceras hygrometricum]|uniref:Uncharacterized protein n=1 Tax=Dorcoceras hygrometricum TaxID=472368 RepID=A0A2Z6ZXU7_9LAMI|nr:hypothetical protein F511_44562 [Dorcoceras hygrometricum]
MFKELEYSGLRGFLGCSADIYEGDLETFFANAFVRGNAVISSVQGKFIEISEEQFADVLELPSEGLTTVDQLPKDLIKEARKVFSASGDLIKTSCKKKEMKVLKLTETMSDEYSMYIDDLLHQIPEDMMLPSVTAEEPTKIEFGHGIAFREVDWHKATLTMIDPMDKAKASLVEEIKGNPAKEMFALISSDVEFLVQIREAVVEEIYSSSLTSVSDLAAKEEQMLQWAETDSLQTAVRRRLYITAKLEWTRPSFSKLFGGVDVYSGGIHSQFYPNIISTSWVRPLISIDGSWQVVEGADLKPARLAMPRISRPKRKLPQRPFVDAFAPICIFIEPVQDLDSRRPYSTIVQRNWAEIYTDVVQFSLFGHLKPVDDIPQTSQMLPTVVLPTDFAESIAQLHASIDQIKIEQLQTRDSIDELKAALSGKITRLEMAFVQSTSRQDMVFRAEINDVRKEIQMQKAALMQELTDFRLETQEGLNTLRAQLLKSLPILIEDV